MSRSRRRIVIIPAWYPHAEAPGNGVFIHDQAQCLAEYHDVTVIFPDYAAKPRALMTEERIDGVRVLRFAPRTTIDWTKYIPGFPRPTSSERYYRSFWDAARRGFAHYVRTIGKPDIIHAHVVLPAGWIGQRLASEWNIPIVLTEHSGPFTFHLATPWQRQLARETLSRVNRLIAVSPALSEVIQACFSDLAPLVLGNVIRTDFFTPAPVAPNQRCRFLAVGTLVPEKGTQHLLEAASILRANGFDDFEVLIVGDGPHRAALEQMTDKLALRSCCSFLGHLDRDSVRREIRQCDVFVTPSHGETFGVAVCEAMACGKPVVATKCGGPEFTVHQESGILVSVGKPYELADVMAGFLRHAFSFDPQTIRQSIVTRFGPRVFIDRLETIYDQILDTPSLIRRAA